MRTSPPPVSGADRISALPGGVLQDILSLLPADEAVRTCVLARGWRHLWRSITSLRLVRRDGPGPVRDLWKFVDNLLNLREKRTDLHTVEIKYGEFSEDDLPYVGLWIRSAVMCKVRSLTLHHLGPFLYLDGLHLASRHLRTVDLPGVALHETFLDFASCPALEDLKMDACVIWVDEISSSSLKHLSITGCLSNWRHCRLHVSAPGLVSLKLDGFSGVTPFFENMVLLEMASVNLGCYSPDICCNYLDSGIFCGADNACPTCDDYSGDLVLLGCISSARHLELISESRNARTFFSALEVISASTSARSSLQLAPLQASSWVKSSPLPPPSLNQYSIAICVAALETMEDLTIAEKSKSLRLFKCQPNREIFLNTKDPILRTFWLKEEIAAMEKA